VYVQKMRMISLAVGLTLPVMASWASDPVIVDDGEVRIDTNDLKNLVELQIPENRAAFFWSDEKAVRNTVADLYMVRRIASDARQEGLDEEMRWAVDYFADRALMNLRLRQVTEERIAEVDLDLMAQEYYQANPEEFTRPEKVRVSHILIGLDERDEAEARELADELYAELKADPSQFSALASKYSDDDGSAGKGGDLGFFSKGRMVKPFEEAAFELEKPGDLAGPVKTRFGFHIIRLDDKKGEGKRPFEVVETKLMDHIRQKVENRAKEAYLAEIRSGEDIQADQDVINSLIKPLPDPRDAIERKEGSSAVE